MIRLYLNHFTAQIGSQLKMIDQITLIGQGNTVGSLPGRLYVKYGKTGIITGSQAGSLSDNPPRCFLSTTDMERRPLGVASGMNMTKSS